MSNHDPKKPTLAEIFTNSEYGLIQETPPGKVLTAVRDALDGWHRDRTLFNLEIFFQSYESETHEDTEARNEFVRRFEDDAERELIFNTLPIFLEDRDAKAKLPILARIFLALIRSEITKDRFYDLVFVLERMNVRSISFLRRMGADMGFEVRGAIDEYVDDGAILIAAGIASKEDSMLKVYPLGRELYKYL